MRSRYPGKRILYFHSEYFIFSFATRETREQNEMTVDKFIPSINLEPKIRLTDLAKQNALRDKL